MMTDAVAVNENPSTITEGENQSITISAAKSSVNAKLKRIASSNDQVALVSKVAKVAKSKTIRKPTSSKQVSPNRTPEARKLPRNQSQIMNPTKFTRPKKSDSMKNLPVASENSSVTGSKKKGQKKLSIRISKSQKMAEESAKKADQEDLKENSSVSQEVQSTTRIKIEVPVLKNSPKETAKKKSTQKKPGR